MLHSVVLATIALVVLVHVPLDRLTRTVLAKVRSERPDIQKANQTKEFANSILKWRASQAPAIIDLQGEGRLRSHGGTSLDAVGFVLYPSQNQTQHVLLG